MEILIYMDDDDKDAWFAITEFYNKAMHEQSLVPELRKKTAMFWHDMIEKYPVLRNKQLHVDAVNSTISMWTSQIELRR